MCYGDEVKAQMTNSRLGAVQAMPVEDKTDINVTKVKNGYVVAASGYKNGKWFHHQYVGYNSYDVSKLVTSLLNTPAPPPY